MKKRDWKIFRWTTTDGENIRGFCPTTEDPWAYFDVPTKISLEHKATLHACTEEQAQGAMEALLV